jgi:hypothetical protein
MNIEPTKVHRLKNQLAIILGFCELLLEDMPADDVRRADVAQIQQAAKTALGELPPLPAHEFSSTLDKSPEANNAG